MTRRKKITRILLYLLLFLGFIGLAGLLMEHFLNKKLQEIFIRELNKQLVTEVSVQQVKLSLFRDFPYASMRFSGVTLKEAVPRSNKGILMKAGTIALRFGLLDLLRDKFTVTNVLVKDAKFNMRIYADGTDNYHFWKETKSDGSKEFSIDLQKIVIQNTRFTYKDEGSRQDLRILVKDAGMKGHFADAIFSLATKGDILLEQYSQENISYVSNRSAAIDMVLQVDTKQDKYTFERGELALNDLKLSTAGWITNSTEKQDLDLTVSTPSADLQDLISAIPETYRKQLSDYKFEGESNLSVKISGSYATGKTPSVKAILNLKDGTIGRSGSSVSLEAVELTASYSLNGMNNAEYLDFSKIKAKLKNGFVEGRIQLNGLSSTHLTAILKADLDLSDVHELIKLDTVNSLAGRMLLEGSFDGKLADLKKPTVEELNRSVIKGKATISNGELGLKGFHLPVTAVNGSFGFMNNRLQINTAGLKYGKSDFGVKGNVNNLMAYFLVPGQKLEITGTLSSSRTDWDELSESSSGSGDYSFQLPSDINIPSLKIQMKNFSFRKFSAASISADLKLSNRMLFANHILMQSMKGVVSGQASINASNPGYSLIQCKANLSKVNVKSLFAEFGNFGTTDLTSENLDGAITADVIYASTMYPNLDIDLQTVKAHADIRIENGRLVNYEPMKGLSKFLRVEDLADIRFETLQNQIDIANRIIYIPNMMIKSSAIDLSLMGTHTFDNEIDYHFSLALADLLAAKFRKKNPTFSKQSEFGPEEEDNRGRSMVYVSMTGTVDNPEFQYDRKAMRDKLSSELKTQKAELKAAFKKEFGRQTQDSLRLNQNSKEKAIQKQQEEGKFVIEWDDDKK
ncbi:MAG: hypothetical protein IPH88_10550 [Bacteroidales bacterium]|nr:hypothetical protein [Bacteroidales bacterium]